MVKVPHKTLERNLFAQGYDPVIAVDEVGMACLAGPVTVCAVLIRPGFFDRYDRRLIRMRDSKTLLPHHRERYARILRELPGLMWRVASCEPARIDELNIYQASRLAMRNAISELGVTGNPIVLVDGNKKVPGLTLPQQAIIRGDRKVWSIAAASIIAKVHRDALMTALAAEYPGYGFEVHKGYPTALHRERLAALGPCPLHRRSFHGVDGN